MHRHRIRALCRQHRDFCGCRHIDDRGIPREVGMALCHALELGDGGGCDDCPFNAVVFAHREVAGSDEVSLLS